MFGGTEYSGRVLDINWYYTVLLDGGQRRILPNSSVIISVITIVSNSGMELYTVPLPYSVPVHAFEEELEQVTSGQARVNVKEFGEQTYTVQVKLPSGVDRDLLREAIRKRIV
ncbi:MAG: MscS Mechanosensitive ion channel [Bacilli bacterium]|nr:MscS Mechanosensitive ion channel [Bacilli bacterium]